MRYCDEMYGTRFVQFYGWYVRQAYLRLGILPTGDRYLRDTCPPEYQTEIDEVLLAEREYRRELDKLMELASGPKRADIPDDEPTYWRNVRTEDAVAMIDRRSRAQSMRRAFTKKIENIARQDFGFRKVGEGWVSETQLFYIVKRMFSEHEVLFHHRPDWLDGLEMDVYIPCLKIGFEYQGAQHFHPVEFWGGRKALEQVQRRDLRKVQLCALRGVKLIVVDYREPLSEDHIRSLLT
ncbi:MAG: hypothetical protein KBC96_10750 [Armatimonadetes bacterium]|nr:hypothetical protein [Armatimonadota bacterium]